MICQEKTSFIGLAPGVSFINLLRAAFAPVDHKSVKRYWQLDWILTILGATGVKAVRKYVGEIEPRSREKKTKEGIMFLFKVAIWPFQRPSNSSYLAFLI